MRSLHTLLISVAWGAVVGAFLVGTAEARDVLFDFDTDGDPSTIENEVSAEVGEILVGHMVLNDFDEAYNYIWAMQYGLEITDGLELLGWYVEVDRGGLLNDGHEGIAMTFGNEPFAREDLPVFAVRFVVRVLDASPQSVRIVPSTGWNTVFDHIQLLLSVGPDGYDELIDSPETESEQMPARINGPTPIEETSWSAIKRLFEDDAI